MKIFLITLLCLLNTAAYANKPLIQLDRNQARLIGEKIWHNEGLGKVENLTVWNKGEDFPSFGIGHFIWYPRNVDGPFQESFPQLIQHLRKTTQIPAWLIKHQDAPWPNRNAFYEDINSAKMKSLRELLQRTVPQQVELIIQRMESALPKMLATLETEQERQYVEQQFYRVANQPNGIYALIDYVNFKGEGTSERERYQGQGWGLLQVLKNMNAESNEVMREFANAADFVLTRRVNNAPRDESRWLTGWRNRLKTYY